MNFLSKVISELLAQNQDLSSLNIILPGKRPVVFIKDMLRKAGYSGFLPNFFTIEELVQSLSDRQEIKGVPLWLFAYSIYAKIFPNEDLASFLKWFPTLLKDWDDMLKFSEGDQKILEYMLDDERIKNWGESLGEEDNARKKNLHFWRKMNTFLPELKKKLAERNWATAGMLHEEVREKIHLFAEKTNEKYVFCGFNAFTPVEELLIRNLLQWDKAQCFFQADEYYINDERQEAGKFLREHLKWKEFNENRAFHWVENQFSQPKNIKVYEVAGNVAQAKILPEILKTHQDNEETDTAVVLLDENLLPASLDAMSGVEKLNITMGFPMKNLSFSNAMKHLFYLQKNLEKQSSSYYYNDILTILEEIPNNEQDKGIVAHFLAYISEHNIVYISRRMVEELLGKLSFYSLLEKQSTEEFLNKLITFCYQAKSGNIDDIQYENIAHFEQSFKMIKTYLEPYPFEMKMETLEVLVNQIINSETIDFQGEPLSGLQVMGLLETRLLNFKNVILLSTNEGKLPLGNSQNTYLPFDVRRNFNLNTFLENDSIYAYHFYRLIQDAENVHLLYNGLSSGVNTGEKSRFITQLEMESGHQMAHIIIENASEPIFQEPIKIQKTPQVMEKLEAWKSRVAASHLVSYLYNPIDFYLNNVLKVRETAEIEEELSVRNYGSLVHYALEFIYEQWIGKILTNSDLEQALTQIDEAMKHAIETLKHQHEFYEKGMNFIHKSMAKRVVEEIIRYDLALVEEGNRLEIIGLEKKIESVPFNLNENNEKIFFYGFVDRIDKLNDTIRIIDYKTSKANYLTLKIKENKVEQLLMDTKYKQALQLCIYAYCLSQDVNLQGQEIRCGIWSFAEVGRGVQSLEIVDGSLDDAMISIKNIVNEILDVERNFEEK